VTLIARDRSEFGVAQLVGVEGEAVQAFRECVAHFLECWCEAYLPCFLGVRTEFGAYMLLDFAVTALVFLVDTHVEYFYKVKVQL
jgi:hypothetical protein